MARPLVFTANGREPPGRHLSSTRFQNAFSTGVEAALASLLGFTSEQPDGGRSHCGAPGSRTTALVCPEALGAAEFTRNPFAKPEGIALSPKTHGLSEDLAAVASPEAAPSTQPKLVGCAAPKRRALTIQVSPVEKASFSEVEQVPPRKTEVRAA